MTTAEPLRDLIITSVMDRAGKNGGFVTRADLSFVSLPTGGSRRVIDAARGIWNPRDMEATLSVVSSPSGPYADREVEGGLFHYSYREGSINGDNAKLRRAFELGVPIILLRKVRDGVYVPYAPVYVVDDLVGQREFLLALDESVRFLGSGNLNAPERRYAERVVRQRLHQAEFRGRVIAAYQTRCAVCRLRHGELLDAAHIIADRDEAGLPAVSNGLALCKIHHAAFDMNMLGISPDYVVRIDQKLLEEVDGPMLRHGLQEMHGSVLTVPQRRQDRPDKARLEQRFAEFVQRVS
ncbi:MAG: HNH endonuclease [Actinobacteria bacterium]|nr:HNH endonuclease [Actinomycetota bacterium]